VSERERLGIEGVYYLQATGELEKTAQTYEMWRQTYPRDKCLTRTRPFIAARLGNWEKTLEECREAIRLEPNDVLNYANLGNASANLNRLDEAEAVYKQAKERKLEGETLLAGRYLSAFSEGRCATDGGVAFGQHGKAGHGRFAAGHASGPRGLVWEVEERKRTDSSGNGFSPA
jgi:tetratricopeptide (TPR) repeat protein